VAQEAKPPAPEAAKSPAPAAETPKDSASDADKDLDPFSPEAIEAEFARLLGRMPSKSDR
jgi:hypothetical protein